MVLVSHSCSPTLTLAELPGQAPLIVGIVRRTITISVLFGSDYQRRLRKLFCCSPVPAVLQLGRPVHFRRTNAQPVPARQCPVA